ncbi:GNAT family N-acetyltransferase [Agriterribacter humi]|uniref:GNAT family N-acetyltransferase n=1 Tax=Agriterribacter humi TaxID=1104781 RepID=UPI001D030791|nr:GNAT family N-acetyltransferase [Agriterribacter humi]
MLSYSNIEIYLETGRLRLREFIIRDTAFIIELLNSPAWLQFIGDRNVKTEEQAKRYLEDGPLKSYIENGYGIWLVELKNDNKAIGMCGIINRDFLDNPDIGFAFLPGYHGNGYATEIAGATMDYAKQQLHISTIEAITATDNAKSIRLLEKTGLKFTRKICYPGTNKELLLYSN